MCVLAFSYAPGAGASGLVARPQECKDARSRPRLHLISNRDEFFQRPTAPAHWWTEAGLDKTGRPTGAWVLGGRDLRAGGSWLAVNRAGRVAALTNHRSGGATADDMRSRGELVESWLGMRNASADAAELARQMASEAGKFAGFNLVLFDFGQCSGASGAWVISNRSAQVLTPLAPGVHGLSNDLLNSPWPKTESLKQVFAAQCAAPHGQEGQGDPIRLVPEEHLVLAALRNEKQAADSELPATGIPLERERYLSPVFIRPPDLSDPLAYGTRSSSVLKVYEGYAELLEHTWHPQPGARRFQFRLRPDLFEDAKDL